MFEKRWIRYWKCDSSNNNNKSKQNSFIDNFVCYLQTAVPFAIRTMYYLGR